MGRGGVSPFHFFYEMDFGEAAAFLRGMERRDRQSWEQTRAIIRGMGGEWELPWDNEAKKVVVDEEGVKDLRERIKKVKI